MNVDLQVKARFGKVDGARDYSWLVAQEGTPPHLLRLGESLSQIVAGGKTFLSLVTEAGGEVWLIRAYQSGIDNKYRPIAAAEVAQIAGPRPMAPAHWLGLAAISIQQREREQIGNSNQFSITIPPPHSEPAEPDAESLMRARLGLPLATTTRVAASLLARETWKYQGICFAVRGKDDPPHEWIPDLSPYLCINFAEPPLSPAEQELISIVQTRAISRDEWESLNRLEPAQLSQALQWSAKDNGPLSVDSHDSALLQWLAVYRGAQYSGARLLSRLWRDTTLPALPPPLIEAATHELPKEAAAFVSAAARGERPQASPGVLEYLAREGFLDDELTIPLALWAWLAKDSPTIREHLLHKLTARGYDPEAARFVLDLEPAENAPGAGVPDGLVVAARFAASVGVAPPKCRLLAALRGARPGAQTSILREAALAYGSWGESLARLWSGLELPPEGTLTPEEMLAAIEGPGRPYDATNGLLMILTALLHAGRVGEAAEILKASETSPVISMSPEARRAVRARLGLSPGGAPSSVNELARLVGRNLVRPEDIELTEEHATTLIDYVRLWPGMAPLLEVLSDAPASRDGKLPVYPPSWRGAVRQAVTPSRVRAWLAKLDSQRQGPARRWVASLHELSPGIFEALADGAAGSVAEAQLLPQEMDWLSALFSSAPQAQRLAAITALTRSGALRDNEAAAVSFVSALLPESGERARGLAVHALTGVGPLPMADGLPAEFVLALLPGLDAAALANAIFASYDRNLSAAPEFCYALAVQVERQQLACPAHGYTAAQVGRHVQLAHALSRVTGWERLALNLEARARYARDIIGGLGLRVDDLFNETRQKGEGSAGEPPSEESS